MGKGKAGHNFQQVLEMAEQALAEGRGIYTREIMDATGVDRDTACDYLNRLLKMQPDAWEIDDVLYPVIPERRG